MPVTYQMTWVPASRRWMKKHDGKWYAISCRKLGVPETKEASWRAANAWWDAKLKEIETAPPTEEDLKVNAFKVWSMVQDWKQLSEDDRERLVDSLVGEGQYRKIKAQAEAMVEAAVKSTPPNRTVEAQVDAWKGLLRSACQSRQLSEGRYDAYCRRIRPFTEWIGPRTAIDTIDEAKLEGYYGHLSQQVTEGRYSPSSAHELLMTAKQFISRLAALKLIPLPGNIRDRRFRFNHSAPAEIETFSVEEVREFLAACDGFSERTKLYILLMLNCGQYQQDVAELRQDEVDWKRGTIRRARSKTRERGGPVVTYKLWPETFALLRKHRSPGELVLTTDEGNPLVKEWLEDGKYRKYDAIRSAWHRLAEKMGMKKSRLGMKHLRKTSASLLGEHPQYKFYATHFLADSPKHMTEKHCVKPSEAEFFEALNWLRGRMLGS
jgi:integrase